MFRRREKQSFFKTIKNFLWPEGGWKRYGQYLLLRLNRLKGTPDEIAAGVACGVAISFTPFVGFHFVLAAATAWLVRGNILASAIGTAAGNPWTFPFIWISVLYTGRKILGMDAAVGNVDFIKLFDSAFQAMIHFDFSLFFNDMWPILWPMIVGCIPYYIVAWIASYYGFRILLRRLAERRKKK